MTESAKAPMRLNLALQGGGSHGALTWGVLDALLEDGQWQFDGVSGTSAGAMNAVALAHGFAQAAQQHRDPQEAHQAGCALAREALTRLWEGVGTLGSLMWGLPMSATNPVIGMVRQWLSPYQTNPLGINPLRSLLEREVDFDLLRGAPGGPKVFVCATKVRTGRSQIFFGPRLSVDAVMASACLPLLFKAVEIDGEHYWDGGYSGNPALHPLIYQTQTCDILLVQINPITHLELPHSGPEIMERISEVTFNASLLAELRAIEFVRRLLAEGKLDPQRYKNVRMHRIDGGSVLMPFGADSKMRADLAFVRKLFALGRTAGQEWLQAHRQDVGVRPSIRIADNA
ncbi:patatin-like phospholipase family protein [Verminephrobacter aporrectodeae subsp. tuberculatae]|uniref:patatin-like phospholipase family protein n=1 Tax=Verminephrobacter aporrectodeae TaxID=1110389 RepID=UPI00223775A8|nr:patatin-like phospholipase family protein [Verminephrobacter aporrectodeae]MCW5256357.1 patatin-like phospholipase family protein [Verminephrobacter aporrectodeae subsp. tuberculatae]